VSAADAPAPLLAVALAPRSHVQGGEDAVTGGGVDGVDDVPGLLAAQGVAALEHPLAHVAVAHARLDGADGETVRVLLPFPEMARAAAGVRAAK